MSCNVWFLIGKEFNKLYNFNELNRVFRKYDLYNTINSSSNSSFKKDTFNKLIKILENNNVNVEDLKKMDQKVKINGYDKYLFFAGFGI